MVVVVVVVVIVVVVVRRRAAVQQQLLLTNSSPSSSPSTAFHHHEYSEWRIIDAILFVASLSLQPLGRFVARAKQVFTGQTLTKNASTDVIIFQQRFFDDLLAPVVTQNHEWYHSVID